MALFKEYTIASAFVASDGVVNGDRFEQEIRQSAITVALDSTSTYNGVCTVTFKAEPSAGEITILDGLVAAHSGLPLEPAVSTVKIDSPETSDGKPIFLNCIFPGGVYYYLTGAGDSSSERGAGDELLFSSEESGDTVKEVHFLDWAYEADAIVQFTGAALGDYLIVDIVSPASPVTVNGTNTGNCNLVDAPPCPGIPAGSHIIVPANGNGTHDVDLATANIVPSHDDDADNDDPPNGYWNWSDPKTGRGTITANYLGTGEYHLVDAEVHLVRHGNKCWLLGSGTIDVSMPGVKPKRVLPHWLGRLTLHNSGHTGLKLAVTLKMAREVTVK
jgi:hypothetical protein